MNTTKNDFHVGCIFEGANRVCSKIGGGFSNINLDSIVERVPALAEDYDHQSVRQYESVERTFNECLSIEIDMSSTIDLYDIVHETERDDPEPAFFYHSDHLGSASWKKERFGKPFASERAEEARSGILHITTTYVQHLQYLPFGEPYVDQRAAGSTYSERYTFTGKERDRETGFSYFGARYYDSDLSGLFLSVDPMSDKYPSISPYAYCAWNPVKLIDPMGMDTIVSINIDNGQINMEKNELHNRGCAIQYMNSDNTIIDDYTCNGFVYTYYNKKGAFVIDFGDDSDAEDVYNHLSGRVESQCISSVEWNYYTYNSDNPSQLVTSNKRDEITVTGFGEFNGLLRKMRHYQPYYSDLEYSLPSPEDIRYAREIKAPCHLDYCGKSYRFDNLVPEGYKDPHISIIRHFVKSKNPNYEPYCK